MKLPNLGANEVTEKRKNDGTLRGQTIYNEIPNIIKKYSFSHSAVEKLVRLLYNCPILLSTIYAKIDFIVLLLEKYGYSKEESIKIIEGNFNILQKDSNELKKSVAIASQYKIDEEVLTNYTVFISYDSNLLFALSECLKKQNIEVTESTLIKLSHSLSEKEKAELIKNYPLTPKKVFTLYYMYDQSMKKLNR